MWVRQRAGCWHWIQYHYVQWNEASPQLIQAIGLKRPTLMRPTTQYLYSKQQYSHLQIAPPPLSVPQDLKLDPTPNECDKIRKHFDMPRSTHSQLVATCKMLCCDYHKGPTRPVNQSTQSAGQKLLDHTEPHTPICSHASYDFFTSTVQEIACTTHAKHVAYNSPLYWSY